MNKVTISHLQKMANDGLPIFDMLAAHFKISIKEVRETAATKGFDTLDVFAAMDVNFAEMAGKDASVSMFLKQK